MALLARCLYPAGSVIRQMTFPRAFQSYVPKTHCVNTHTYGVVLLNPWEEILIVRGRLSKKWGFPKGHGSSNEKPLEAALRELKEEAGIDLENQIPFSERRFKSTAGKSGGTYFIYKVEDRLQITVEDTGEIMDAMWCPRERLGSLTEKNMDLTTFCRRRYHLDVNFISEIQ